MFRKRHNSLATTEDLRGAWKGEHIDPDERESLMTKQLFIDAKGNCFNYTF